MYLGNRASISGSIVTLNRGFGEHFYPKEGTLTKMLQILVLKPRGKLYQF